MNQIEYMRRFMMQKRKSKMRPDVGKTYYKMIRSVGLSRNNVENVVNSIRYGNISKARMANTLTKVKSLIRQNVQGNRNNNNNYPRIY
jgi:hypothetical protein